METLFGFTKLLIWVVLQVCLVSSHRWREGHVTSLVVEEDGFLLYEVEGERVVIVIVRQVRMLSHVRFPRWSHKTKFLTQCERGG